MSLTPNAVIVNTSLDPALKYLQNVGIQKVMANNGSYSFPTTEGIINTTINLGQSFVTQIVENTIPLPVGTPNGSVEFDVNGVLTGDSGLTYNKLTDTLLSTSANIGNLHVTSSANLGSIDSVNISGGSPGDIVITDGSGHLIFNSINLLLPRQTGNSGKYLTTNGFENLSWDSVHYVNIQGTPTLSTVATSGSYNDLLNQPALATVATSGSYNDLINKPALATVATSGSYNDLTNKPALATVATSGSYNNLTNKPTIPTTFETLGDAAINTGPNPIQPNQTLIYDGMFWKNGFVAAANVTGLATVATSGSYNDLLNKPTNVNYTDNNVASYLTTYTGNLAAGNISVTTGNISIDTGYFVGNGAFLTGLPPSYTDSNVTTLFSTFASAIISSANITTSANISANNISTNTINQIVELTALAGNNLQISGGPVLSENLGALVFTGTQFLTTPQSIQFALGLTFTIEWWQNATQASTGITMPILSQEASAVAIDIVLNNGQLELFNNTVHTTLGEPTPGQWTHVAVVANNGALNIFYNGTLQYNVFGTFNPLVVGADVLAIGRRGINGGGGFIGSLAGIRITNTVVYPTSFGIPTTAPTNISGTILLINSIGTTVPSVESSSNQFTLTNYGVTANASGPGILVATYIGDVIISSNSNNWVFDNTGNLTLPTNTSKINYANGTSILDGLGGGGFSGNYNDLTDKPTIYPAEPRFTIKTSNFNASIGVRYGVDTTSSAITATLPASPTVGDAIYFADAGGAYPSNNLVVARNGSTIMGSASDMTVTIDNQSFGLLYNGTTWRVY